MPAHVSMLPAGPHGRLLLHSLQAGPPLAAVHLPEMPGSCRRAAVPLCTCWCSADETSVLAGYGGRLEDLGIAEQFMLEVIFFSMIASVVLCCAALDASPSDGVVQCCSGHMPCAN